MKEFVEKLISKLEEEIVFDTFDHYKEEPLVNMSFERLEDIITQLSEEYINTSTNTSTDTSSGWIPCSERLPEGNDDVMVIYTDNDGEVDICCLDWFLAYSDTMLAWMPLPEPYKPQKEAEWKDHVMKHFTKVE